jgi:hypothetical protein
VPEFIGVLDRERLAGWLVKRGVDPAAYSLEGGHPSERYVLDRRGNEWVVFYSERGLETGLRSFQPEDLACRHLVDLLWKDHTVRPECGERGSFEPRTSSLSGKPRASATIVDPCRELAFSSVSVHRCTPAAVAVVTFCAGWTGAFAKKMHPVEVIVEVITVWWQYIIIVALLALGIYGFVVLVRTMTRQLTRKTDRRAEDMYDEFDSARKEKDRWPV